MAERLTARHRAFAILCFCAFIAYAIYVNSFGSNAATMMDFFHITESRQGFILTAQSIGGMVTAIFLLLYGERYNKIYVISVCLAVMALGSILIGTMPHYLTQGSGYIFMLLFVLLAGIGFTGIDVMMNGAITETFPTRKDTLLPVAHGFYSTGAMMAPIFVGSIINTTIPSSFALPFLVIGIFTAVLFLGYAYIGHSIVPSTPYADMTAQRARASENPAEVFRSIKAWLLLAASLLYFSFMYGLSTWLYTYFIEVKAFGHHQAAIMPTIFFLGALIMRFLSPIFFKLVGVGRFYIASGILSAICIAAAFLSDPSMTYLITAMILLSGFFQGAHVVALVVMGCNDFPKRTASASAITVLAFNLAAMTVPLIIGSIAEARGFRIPMYLLVLCLMGSVFVVWIKTIIGSRKPAEARKAGGA